MNSFAVILLYWFIAELLVQGLNIPFPGSILGMIFLFLSLIFNWISFEIVDEASLFFRKNLILFFIPAGVLGLKYIGLLQTDGPALILSACLSSALLLIISGKLIS